MGDFSDIPAPPRGRCGGPSLHELRRLDAGELTGEALARVRAHVDGCPECATVLRDFEDDRRALALTLPEARLQEQLQARLPAKRRPWRWVLGSLVPVAAGAALVLLVPSPTDVGAPGVRAKGAQVELGYLVRLPAGAREGSELEPVRPGDQLRLRYQGARAFVLVFGVDADGKVSPWVADGERSAPARPGRQLSPGSLVMDADPRPERLFAIYTDEPLGLDAVRDAVRQALEKAGSVEAVKALALPGDQATVLLRKASGGPQ